MNFGLHWIMQFQCESKLYQRGEKLAMAYFFFFRRNCCWKVLFHWLLNRTENMDFCALSDLSAYPFACSLIWFVFFICFVTKRSLLPKSEKLWAANSMQVSSFLLQRNKKIQCTFCYLVSAWEEGDHQWLFLPSFLGKLHQKDSDEFIARLSLWPYLLVCCKCLQC